MARIVGKSALHPRALAAALVAIGCSAFMTSAAAQAVVTCRSLDDHYAECPAPDFTLPQLVYQMSRSACIVNRTWGFDRDRGILWVDDGCAGRFADVGGYHRGRTGQFDPGARRYNAHGRDAGPFVGGQALGALLAGDSPASPEREDPAARRSNPAPAAPAATGTSPGGAAMQAAPQRPPQPDAGNGTVTPAPAAAGLPPQNANGGGQ